MDDLVDEFQYRSENTDDGGLWETEELMRHVESTITKVCQCSNVRLFVDALDECNTEIDAEDTNQDIRYLIRRLEALEENLRDAPYKFSACLACRHYPNIARPAVDHVIVAEKGNQEDIGKYLRRVLDQELDENGSKLKGQLQEFVSKEANGNFQWVKLVTAQAALMYNDGDNHVRILSEVQKLPKTLSRMYEATVTSLVARRGAMSLKLFRWVSFARWPLTLSELRRALNMTADLSSTLPDYDVDSPDYVENDTQMRKLVSVLSGGLVEIRNTSEVRADTLFLIHQSVKDYLMASGFQLLCPEIQSSHDALISGHSLLLESCLQSLSGSTFGSVEGTTSLPREVVLSTTTALASSFRTTKILRALSQNSSSLESLLKPKILSDKRVARDKNDIQNILNTLTPSTRREIRDLLCGYTMSRGSSESDLVLLYFFCICHLDPEKKALDRYSSSFWIEHALELSQNEAGADVEKLMAKFGSRTSQAQWMHLHFKGSLIHERKCIQDPTILRTLIHAYHLKEISFNDGIAFAKSTPLTIASAAGYLESVKILLSDALVSVNEQEIMTGMSPLHWAARNGHTLIVEELLRRGADVDNQDGSHKTPLLHAVEKNENATAELLLEHGARVDIKSDAQDTPMVHAIRLNRHRICAVMLERQSLDHDSSNAVWNAIRNACGSGDVGVLRTIFESGFGWKLEERLDSSQYPGYFHRSLLEAAIRKDRSQILNHLDIKRYAELHPQRTMHLLFETARALAADCLSLLVSKHGYKVNSRDEMGNTLFHTAMNSSYAGSGFHSPGFRRYLEVVFSLDLFNEELILNCPNALGVSPLQRILYADGDLDFVYFMLSYPQLDINWTGTRGSALFVAIETGNFACAERLLADPQIDPNIGTPQGQGKSNFIACLARRDMAWTELILRHKDLKITANDKELVMNEPYWSVYIPNLSELALSEAARSDLQELRDLIPKLSDISSSSSEKSNADG
jgi:ankyrin repeat protein